MVAVIALYHGEALIPFDHQAPYPGLVSTARSGDFPGNSGEIPGSSISYCAVKTKQKQPTRYCWIRPRVARQHPDAWRWASPRWVLVFLAPFIYGRSNKAAVSSKVCSHCAHRPNIHTLERSLAPQFRRLGFILTLALTRLWPASPSRLFVEI